MARHLMVGAAIVALFAGQAGSAMAQSAADKAAAEQLFNEARTLMTKKKYSDACPKFEASLKLDPALGTRLNLANCYEENGQLASAWGMYREAEDLAQKTNEPKRVKFARDRAKALEPRLPRLVIKAPAEDAVPGLTVVRDGTAIDRAVFDTAIYVDPGERTIEASAPGFKPFSTKVVAVEGKKLTVEIPALEREPRKIEPPVVDPDRPVGPVTPGITGGPGDTAASSGSSRRILGLGVAGAGVVALGVGMGFGLSAKSKWDKAFDDGLCDSMTKVCSAEGQSLTDSARTRATISTVLVGTGVIMAAGGAFLFFTAPRREVQVTRVIPSAGPDSVGIAVTGRF